MGKFTLNFESSEMNLFDLNDPVNFSLTSRTNSTFLAPLQGKL